MSKNAKYAVIQPGLVDNRRRPEKKSFGTVMYDSNEGTFCTRTPLSWLKIIVFYIIFYSCLAGFFALHMHFFMSTISEDRPKWTLDESLIGSNPGLGYLPFPEDVDTGTGIFFKSNDQSTAKKYVDRLNEMLNGYFDNKKLPNKGKNQMICSFDQPPKKGQACAVPIQDWSPCTKEDDYSYYKNSPCILLKLNRIYGWVPEPFNDTSELPEDMPEDLKKHIADLQPNERNQVWVDCRGEQPLDVENIGPIQYASKRGFPTYYFPYLNVKDYLSPLVAIRLERPNPRIMISVECRAWAKNIIYAGGRDRTGSVRFEVMID